ncbi:MAG: polyprenyl synthetase family protein, partial [Thermoleophilia bacterium]|nr:polyprenyl synthetase family protein [Thermoleophilia bacterium]
MRADAPESVLLDDALAGWRIVVNARLTELVGGNDTPPSLLGFASALTYSLLAPGKRIRPALVLAAADACGVTPVNIAGAVDVACAWELIHTYSLVHDDLPAMDDDALRRGMPTSHVKYGDGVAILVGDALQAEAFRVVADARGVGDRDRVQLVSLLARAA